MVEIQIITDEWIDYLLIDSDKNIIRRKANNDSGKFIFEGKLLKIDWNKWGLEIFENYNNIYYNCSDDLFEIKIENVNWTDICVFNKRTNFVKRKNNYIENGFFNFERNNLIIKWMNNNTEYFLGFNYGKLYKSMIKKHIKVIAIVFPQFHEIPENNKFWGEGFTEWKLLKDIPRIVDDQIIKQPHPDIGYFNLNDYNHRKYMKVLADKYNIFGFCYYHYWFKNKKVMYEPTELMLKDGEPNKPFLFCWANEQWTKRWDGGNNEILIQQEYTDLQGNIDHFEYLLQFFKNKNYIKKSNKPIFIFYRIEENDIENIRNIINLWNELAKKNGFDGIHFMRFLGPFNNNIVMEEIKGFVEFSPGYFCQKYFNNIMSTDHNNIFDEFNGEYNEEIYLLKNNDIKILVENHVINSGYDHYKLLEEKEKEFRTSKFFVYDGEELYKKIISDNKIYNEQHRGISVNWNNTPRRNYKNKEYDKYPHYYKNITSESFGNAFFSVLNKIRNNTNEDDDFLFVSAWNEWNEQAILEPNNEDGYDFLTLLSKNYLEFYDNPKKGNILTISHKGGGTEKYMNDLKKIYLEYNFIDFEDFNFNTNYDTLYENLHLIHINSILFNNLKENYQYLFTTFFKNIKKYLTVHDYQWLYPNDPNILQDNFYSSTLLNENIVNFNNLLEIVSKIIFPTKNIYNNYNIFINLERYKDKIFIINHSDKIINHNFYVIPHVVDVINIAFIGHFTNYKGSNLFFKISNEIKYYNNCKIQYHVFGYKDNEFENIIFHNTYNDSTIIDDIHSNNIHAIFHLSLFEESYCYALTNSINSGLPILYLNRGAFSERLNNNEKYFPCELNNIDNVFFRLLEYIINNQNKNIFHHLNNNVQPSRWYLENYL